MTLLVHLNIFSQAYCLSNFLFRKLFTSFTYFFYQIVLLVLFYSSDLYSMDMSPLFLECIIIYRLWFPVQLCIILWELQDFNYDTAEFTNISYFMIFFFCSWCFVSEITPYSKATNIYLCLLLEYLMLCFFLFVLNPSEIVFAYTCRQEFNFILFPCEQQLVQDDNWIVFPSPLIISSPLSYLCRYSS